MGFVTVSELGGVGGVAMFAMFANSASAVTNQCGSDPPGMHVLGWFSRSDARSRSVFQRTSNTARLLAPGALKMLQKVLQKHFDGRRSTGL